MPRVKFFGTISDYMRRLPRIMMLCLCLGVFPLPAHAAAPHNTGARDLIQALRFAMAALPAQLHGALRKYLPAALPPVDGRDAAAPDLARMSLQAPRQDSFLRNDAALPDALAKELAKPEARAGTLRLLTALRDLAQRHQVPGTYALDKHIERISRELSGQELALGAEDTDRGDPFSSWRFEHRLWHHMNHVPGVSSVEIYNGEKHSGIRVRFQSPEAKAYVQTGRLLPRKIISSYREYEVKIDRRTDPLPLSNGKRLDPLAETAPMFVWTGRSPIIESKASDQGAESWEPVALWPSVPRRLLDAVTSPDMAGDERRQFEKDVRARLVGEFGISGINRVFVWRGLPNPLIHVEFTRIKAMLNAVDAGLPATLRDSQGVEHLVVARSLVFPIPPKTLEAVTGMLDAALKYYEAEGNPGNGPGRWQPSDLAADFDDYPPGRMP